MAAPVDNVTIAITLNEDGSPQRSSLAYAPKEYLLPGQTAVVPRKFFDFCLRRGVPVELVKPEEIPAPKPAAKKKAPAKKPVADFMR